MGELEHQLLAGDEVGRDCAGVLGLEQAGGVPQQLLAYLGRAAHLVAVGAGGGLEETGLQDGEALHVPGGSCALDDPDTLSGARVEPVGQMVGEQRGRQQR
ncbi:hypothetical protein [Streptomyces sp. SAS_260]|uniref:hypothetical protein n=1 Tax=Streptomyces sp. SAS_260 TaxID=3412751 RepID=UPI00403CAA77